MERADRSIEQDVAGLRQDVAVLRVWCEGEFKTLRAWCEGEFQSLRVWADGEFQSLRAWAEGEFQSLRAWAEGEFKAVRQEIQTANQQILATMNRRFAAMTLVLVVAMVGVERYA